MVPKKITLYSKWHGCVNNYRNIFYIHNNITFDIVQLTYVNITTAKAQAAVAIQKTTCGSILFPLSVVCVADPGEQISLKITAAARVDTDCSRAITEKTDPVRYIKYYYDNYQ